MVSVIEIGVGDAPERFQLVDCKVVLDRPYDNVAPKGNMKLDSLMITVFMDTDVNFFHRWHTEKRLEEVCVKIELNEDKGIVQNLYLSEAYCYALNEEYVRVGGEEGGFTRLLKVAIKAQKVLLDIRTDKLLARDEEQIQKKTEDENCYYHLGDIVKYNDRYYVCVSNHSIGEKARFITLNDMADHSKKEHSFNAIPWNIDPDHDTVYSDEMASAETAKDWVVNILLKDSMYNTVYERIKNAGNDAIKQLIPEDNDKRENFIKILTDEDYFILSIHQSLENIGTITPHIYAFRRDALCEAQPDGKAPSVKNAEVTRVLPLGHLLVDKMRYSTVHSKTYRWVPYIFLGKAKAWREYYKNLEFEQNQQKTVPSHFKYERMEPVSYKGKRYYVLKVAIFWTHDIVKNYDDYFCPIMDFTMNDEELGADGLSVGAWENYNVTSSEYVFKDKGVQNSNLESFWVKKEKEG